ncbi:protein SEED AND ROOT HAIR PROTECTIVE PROTEIN-like [Salvia miltiorrhiza]|uniref:protein SEED AND ROOT HAIR PROTECTIVE PROTEIN-like n=1 Tax=Salvia miltiorrhiza TaxID=226208 RepID=UPI0025AD9B7A|nr:protein SEED AND ROOT HAIR PROTECTIVE PROTEIN-like [Salvia miltiorrhiza]
MAMGKRCSLLLTLYLFPLTVIVGASASGYGYGPNPNSYHLKNKYFPEVFSVQGIVYCKSTSGVFPLKGSVVRITCLGLDKYGYETAPFSVLSRPTDANGYFLAKLSSELLEADGVKIVQCKTFLHSSKMRACPYATNISSGVSGAPLSAYRMLGSANMRLYSVGPFVYTFTPQQTTPSPY